MHATIRTLLELHEVNQQLLRLVKQRKAREEVLRKAQAAHQQAATRAAETQQKAGGMDALMRQYQADVERCERTIQELRGKQMTAKTNKEYVGIINGVEEAKSEKKLREQSLTSLGAQIGELQAAAAKAAEAEQAAAAKVAEAQAGIAAAGEQSESESALQRIYDEKKAQVEAKFLEQYERLVIANHAMPLMRVDPATRATPYGTIISHNHLEQIRLGHLVMDPPTKAILYVDE